MVGILVGFWDDRVEEGLGLVTPQGSKAWAGGVVVTKTKPPNPVPRRGLPNPGGVQLGPVEPVPPDDSDARARPKMPTRRPRTKAKVQD